MLVFGKIWFEKHQRALLFLLNNAILKYWFRWIVRIRKFDLPYSTKIFRIEPNCLTWKTGKENEFTTDFRTHNKYARRLYHAFKYFWYVLHFLDFLFDYYPKLNFSFGFDTLTAYPDPNTETYTVDGNVGHQITTGATWSTLRDGAGTEVTDNATYTSYGTAQLYCSAFPAIPWMAIYRSIFLFKTDSLTVDATISGAVLSLMSTGNSKTDSWYALGTQNSMNFVSSNPASNTVLSATDYATLGTTRFVDTDKTYQTWSSSTTVYMNFTLNSSGVANISLDGISKFGGRCAFDIDNSPPAEATGRRFYVQNYFAENTGTTKDPKLVVTYTLPAPTMKSYVY